MGHIVRGIQCSLPAHPTRPTTTRRKPIHSPNLPDVLTLESARNVTTLRGRVVAERRPDIVELFEREVLGSRAARRPEGHMVGSQPNGGNDRRVKAIFTELLGPPGAEDHAPPPTGDLSR